MGLSKFLTKTPKGQSVLEILIALTLLVLTSTATLATLGTSLPGTADAERIERAQTLAAEGLEAVRQIRNRDFALLSTGTFGLVLAGNDWTFNGTEDVTADFFHRSIAIIPFENNENERDVTVTVSWSPRAGLTATTQARLVFTNWANPSIYGNWSNAMVVGSTDIGPEGKGSGITLDGTLVYLSADSSSGKHPSFFVFDVSIAMAPILIGSLTTTDDLTDILAVPGGSVVYTTGSRSGREFRVFDVSNPRAPVNSSWIDLGSAGYSLAIVGSSLYVGTSNGLHIFDINNPMSPVARGYIDLATNVRDVAVADNIAYVATPKTSEELMLVDVSNPSAPLKIASYDLAGSPDAVSVAADASRLYLGRENNTGSNPEFYVYDRTVPAAPALVTSIDVSGAVNDINAQYPYLFLATQDNNEEFKVYRLTNPATLVKVDAINTAQSAEGLVFGDNTIYMVLRSNDALQIIQPSP